MGAKVSVVSCPNERCQKRDWKTDGDGFRCVSCDTYILAYDITCPGCGTYRGTLGKRPGKDFPYDPRGRDAVWCNACANDPAKVPVVKPKLLTNKNDLLALQARIQEDMKLMDESLKALKEE